MFQLYNYTPLPAALCPGVDKHGQNYLLVLVKGTFSLSGSCDLCDAEAQVPIFLKDEFVDDAATSSLRYEADTAPYKKHTDVFVNGCAYSTNSRSKQQLIASVQIQEQRADILVSGERYWERDGAAWRASLAKPFEKIALCGENAFGGTVLFDNEKQTVDQYEDNPVGKGYLGQKKAALDERVPLPNLEDPRAPIQSVNDIPKAVGFGARAKHWLSRRRYAGTYDKQWQDERMPFLPLDFDDQFYNAAYPEMWFDSPIVGGEYVRLTHLNETGECAFYLPRFTLDVKAKIKRDQIALSMRADTLVIEPDNDRMMITWRSMIHCATDLLYVNAVTVRGEREQ